MKITYITPPCIMCHKTSEIELDSGDLYKYQKGALVQNVFPDWDADKRELFITGTHPKCWEEMTAGFDEGDYEDEDAK